MRCPSVIPLLNSSEEIQKLLRSLLIMRTTPEQPHLTHPQSLTDAFSTSASLVLLVVHEREREREISHNNLKTKLNTPRKNIEHSKSLAQKAHILEPRTFSPYVSSVLIIVRRSP